LIERIVHPKAGDAERGSDCQQHDKSKRRPRRTQRCQAKALDAECEAETGGRGRAAIGVRLRIGLIGI